MNELETVVSLLPMILRVQVVGTVLGLLVALNVSQYRARKKMTPEQREAADRLLRIETQSW